MKKNMGYILIVVGIVLLVAGIFCLTSTAKSENTTNVELGEKAVSEKKVEQTPVKTESPKGVASPSKEELSEQVQKGREFEQYVVSHFNKKYFTLKEWRGDKIYNGRYAESNRYPDMEWEFSMKDVRERFAVECKWRSAFNNDWVEWATDEQMNIYKQFEKDEQMPVVVVIGIGGEPSSPAQVYCVPLKMMKMSNAKKSYIEKYQRKDVDDNFYYDVEKQVLR